MSIPGTERERLDYGDLVAFYVDTYRSLHQSVPPRKIRDRFGKEIGALIKERVAPDHLRRALEIAAERGLNPDQLANAVLTAQTEPRRKEARGDGAMLDAFLKANGRWPTGSRFVRGTHSGTYVHDPLGSEEPSYPVPWSRPKRADVIAALKEKEVRDGKSERAAGASGRSVRGDEGQVQAADQPDHPDVRDRGA